MWAEFLTDDPAAWKVRIGEHYMFQEDATQLDIDIERILFHPDRNRELIYTLITFIYRDRYDPVSLIIDETRYRTAKETEDNYFHMTLYEPESPAIADNPLRGFSTDSATYVCNPSPGSLRANACMRMKSETYQKLAVDGRRNVRLRVIS